MVCGRVVGRGGTGLSNLLKIYAEGCASPSERDMARWVHMVAVLAMAALIANSQCYALCLASICHTDDCHHSSHSSSDGNSGCHYGQANSAGVEASPDLAKIPVASLPAAAVHLPAQVFLVGSSQGYSQPLERGSPPGKSAVLRI